MNSERNTTTTGSSIEGQFAAARQKVTDDSLMSTLSLVIRANVEYAKGVTDLISSDLEREDKLDEIKASLKDLEYRTQQLIASQEQLLSAIKNHETADHIYLDKKLSPLYKAASLQEDGTEYKPADKTVMKITDALNSKIIMVVAGAIITWIAKIIIGSLTK